METTASSLSNTSSVISFEEFAVLLRTAASIEKNVYAIFDAAADDSIYPLLIKSDWEYRCLFKSGVHFEGKSMSEPLASTAPYLVKLNAEKMQVERLINERIGKHQFIILKSGALTKELADHCSNMLRVMDEDGKVIGFRYYDPRILRVYIPTCTEEEKTLFFGPVETFWVESDDNEVIQFSRPALVKEERKEAKPGKKPESPPVSTEHKQTGYGIFGNQWDTGKEEKEEQKGGYGVVGDYF